MTCGTPASVIADKLGIDSVSAVEDALHVAYRHRTGVKDVFCHWCWADITNRVQYTLGIWTDGYKVCGVNCPARPKQEAHMSMSRKDYDAMAEILVSQRRFIGINTYRRLVRNIGAMYAKDNPRFKADKWRKATKTYDL